MPFKAKNHAAPAKWGELLLEAIDKPGMLNPAFKQFHPYSIGNIMLMMFQCASKQIPCGPMATYKKWMSLGRKVKRGQKAIVLCQPKIWVRKEKQDDGSTKETPLRFFGYYAKWFVLDQTEGDEIEIPDNLGEWNKNEALTKLGINVVEFDHYNGNVLGFAKGKSIAISPLIDKVEYFGTLFHELAHVVLGHTIQDGKPIIDSERLPRSLKEAEAESVAYLLLDTLNLKDNMAYSRSYIQNWLEKNPNVDAIPEASSRSIFTAANKILTAGLPQAVKEEN